MWHLVSVLGLKNQNNKLFFIIKNPYGFIQVCELKSDTSGTAACMSVRLNLSSFRPIVYRKPRLDPFSEFIENSLDFSIFFVYFFF